MVAMLVVLSGVPNRRTSLNSKKTGRLNGRSITVSLITDLLRCIIEEISIQHVQLTPCGALVNKLFIEEIFVSANDLTDTLVTGCEYFFFRCHEQNTHFSMLNGSIHNGNCFSALNSSLEIILSTITEIQ